MKRRKFPVTMKMRSTGFLATVLLAAAFSFAQTQPAQAGPIPAQVAAAKKIFIANVPGFKLPDSLGGPTIAYNKFYAAIQTWGHYEIVPTPSDADLIYEISFVSAIVGVGGTESGCSSSSSADIQLVIVDPKTRTRIWWLQQDIQGAFRAKTWEKNFDAAMVSFISQVKALTTLSPPAPEIAKP